MYLNSGSPRAEQWGVAPSALIIEDEPEDALLLSVLLRREGLAVRSARDLSAACALAERHRPDLVVLDLASPGEGSLARCRSARREPRLAQLPLIAVGLGDEQQWLDAGADAFIAKPLVPRRLEAQVRTALQPKEEADSRAAPAQVDTQWLRYLVHDLNNPLTVIGGSLGLLQLDSLSDRQSRALQHAVSAQDRLSRMVRAILDVHRVDAGGALSLELSPVPVRSLLEGVAEAIRPIAADRRCTVTVSAADADVLGDGELLFRALVNLADNAARHTARKTAIELGARILGGDVVLSVRDHGPGLPPGEAETLFQPFSQGHGGRGGGAAGLGLAWCRLVADAHGGRAWAEDAAGGGAAFYVSLPRSIANARLGRPRS